MPNYFGYIKIRITEPTKENEMNRRTMLKATAFTLPLTASGLLRTSEVPYELRRGFSGCFGKSKNPAVSIALLNALETCSKGKSQLIDRCACIGKIPEFNAIKDEFGATSEPDLVLKLANKEGKPIMSTDDVKNVFSRINYGSYCAIIGDDDGLWLLRDSDDPLLHVIDMRPSLGQIFFCETAESWRNAIAMDDSVANFDKAQEIIEFPNLQIWHFSMTHGARKYKSTKMKYMTVK